MLMNVTLEENKSFFDDHTVVVDVANVVDGILAGENDILQIRLEFQHVHFQFRYNKCRFSSTVLMRCDFQ